jgi:hypothetical protein
MALMTFGAQKMRGKSTKRSIRDAMLIGSLGQLGGASMGVTPFGSAGTAGTIQGLGQTSAAQGLRSLFPQFASQAAQAAVPAGTGTIAAGSPFAAAGSSALSGAGAKAAVPAQTGIMETLKGFYLLSDAGKIGLAVAGLLYYH